MSPDTDKMECSMKVLVVEDNPERIKAFQRALINHDAFYADTAESASKLIQDNIFELIFLDHDLGGLEYLDSNHPNTGYQVAKKILTNNNNNARIVIHSCNPPGAKNINRLLPNAIVTPFTCLNIFDEVQDAKNYHSEQPQ